MLTNLLPTRAGRRRAAASGILLAACLLAACGGDDGSGDAADGVASLDDTATDDTATDETGSAPPTTGARDTETALLEFADCMREHGVDMPDPQVDENGGVQIEVGGGVGGGAADPDDFREAQEACQELMPDGPMTRDNGEFDPTEMQDQMLEFTECMRDHGVPMDDPDFSDDGRIEVTATVPDNGEPPRGPVLAGPFGTLDLSDPDVAEAFEECGAETGFGPPGAASDGEG